MKHTLLRYPLALVCLLLAAYCFLREVRPVWTMTLKPDPFDLNLQTFQVHGFAPDGQSFWCSRQINGEDVLCEKRECASGKLLAEKQFKKFSLTYDQTRLSTDGRFLIHQTTPVDLAKSTPHPTWLLNLETGEKHRLDNLVSVLHSLSPNSTWLIANGYKTLSFALRQGRKVELELNMEADSAGRDWTPYVASFSPDEALLAVLWTQYAQTGRDARSEFRFYSTSTWQEVTRLRLPDAQNFAIHRWSDQGLFITGYAYPPSSKGAYYQYAYCINHARPLSDKPLVLQPLFECVSHAGLPLTPVNQISNIIQGIGNDWYALLNIDRHERPGWMISLSQLPILSHFMKADRISETRTMQFFQTSRQRLLSSITCSNHTSVNISSDGQWLLSKPHQSNQLALYSNAPLIRWPGYVLALAGMLVLFWRSKRAELHQPPKPASERV